jgi:tripartite-type tricarboxylate transporter receptor subunit TctC
MGSFNSHVVNGAIYALPYDVLKDFAPVALISASGGSLIVGRKTLPANDLADLIAWLKAKEGKALAGTPGVGSSTQVQGAFLQSLTGTSFTQMPYRGAAPAMQDLVAGQIDIMIETPVTGLPQVRAGAIKAFAVTAKRRLNARRRARFRASARRAQYRVAALAARFARQRGRPRHSHRGRGGTARVLHPGWVCDLGAERDA